MAAVNQHAEANALGAAQIEQTVHGGANGAAGVEHVVHDYQVAIVHVKLISFECTTGCGPTVERSSR